MKDSIRECKQRFLILAVFFLCPNIVGGATWHVDPFGTGETTTIQAAVNLSSEGDTILVGAGSYNESISLLVGDIVLVSEQGPSQTILEGTGLNNSIIRVITGEPMSTTIKGFTFRNGTGRSRGGNFTEGGAIYIAGPASVIIVGNVFRDNEALWGGGIFAWPGHSTSKPVDQPHIYLYANVFAQNYANSGGGAILLGNALAEIKRNTFDKNSARYDGGAVFAIGWVSHLTIELNKFHQNECGDKGGALYLYSEDAVNSCLVESNLFVKNSASGSHGIDWGAGGAMAVELNGGGMVRYNTIVLNEGRGSANCSGGGMAFSASNQRVTVTNNLIAYNIGCGIACGYPIQAENITMGPNLYWKNGPENIGFILEECPDWEASIVEDNPMFCDLKGGVYTCEANSPALTNPLGIFGMYPNPGCASIVPVEETTWGKIKALYYEEP